MNDHEWEVRVTIYADGRMVGFVDALGGDLDFAWQSVATGVERRQIDGLTRWGREVLDIEADPA
jgi:hypothetical protein